MDCSRSIATDYPDESQSCPPSVDRKAGEQAVTDGVGNISGVFIIPNGRPPAKVRNLANFGY